MQLTVVQGKDRYELISQGLLSVLASARCIFSRLILPDQESNQKSWLLFELAFQFSLSHNNRLFDLLQKVITGCFCQFFDMLLGLF